jgi:hypothetical protein
MKGAFSDFGSDKEIETQEVDPPRNGASIGRQEQLNPWQCWTEEGTKRGGALEKDWHNHHNVESG